MLKIGHITVHGIRILFTATMDGMQIEKKNEGINNLTLTDLMLVRIITW